MITATEGSTTTRSRVAGCAQRRYAQEHRVAFYPSFSFDLQSYFSFDLQSYICRQRGNASALCRTPVLRRVAVVQSSAPLSLV